jgi:hypothetical protein
MKRNGNDAQRNRNEAQTNGKQTEQSATDRQRNANGSKQVEISVSPRNIWTFAEKNCFSILPSSPIFIRIIFPSSISLAPRNGAHPLQFGKNLVKEAAPCLPWRLG